MLLYMFWRTTEFILGAYYSVAAVQGHGFLSLEQHPVKSLPEEDIEIPIQAASLEDNNVEGQAFDEIEWRHCQPERNHHYYDFHVVYHPSYCVPVLWFRGKTAGMAQCLVFGFTLLQASLCPLLVQSTSGYCPGLVDV